MRAFLLVVFLVISNIVSAQSLYMQSAKNSFSVFGNVLISEDFIVTGPGISYTFNASSNIGLSFVILSDHSDSNVDLDGQGVELYYTYDLLNELRNDLYNLEFGLYLSSAWFDNINANNKSVGLSMSVSDRAYTKPTFYIIPQLELLYVPLSDTEVEINEFSFLLEDEYFSTAFYVGFVFPLSPNNELVLEPLINYNFTDALFSFGANVSLIF